MMNKSIFLSILPFMHQSLHEQKQQKQPCFMQTAEDLFKHTEDATNKNETTSKQEELNGNRVHANQ